MATSASVSDAPPVAVVDTGALTTGTEGFGLSVMATVVPPLLVTTAVPGLFVVAAATGFGPPLVVTVGPAIVVKIGFGFDTDLFEPLHAWTLVMAAVPMVAL
jgi:hypothetical protein